jgi:hypothetical protein
MKKGYLLAAAVLLVLPLAAFAQGKVTKAAADGNRQLYVTVYNQNIALVREERSVDLSAGRQTLRYADVAAQIDPTSVHLIPVSGGGFNVLEQNFQYDLVSGDRLLERSLENTVRVVGKDGGITEGKLLSFDGASLVLDTRDGIKIINRAETRELSVGQLPGGLISRPTLAWMLDANGSGTRRTRLSYLTGGLAWHAEYVAVINPEDTGLSLGGWVSIENQSGGTYPEARLKLVAGDIQLVRQVFNKATRGAVDMMEMQAAAPQFQERSFFEFHLYDLERPTTIADRETKQISLFEPADVRNVEKKYTFDEQRLGSKVNVTLEFKNAEASGLGRPLPAGKVRVYKQDKDGSQEFVGEDLIDHTPRDEKVRLALGKAFDVVAERKQTNYRRISDKVTEASFEIAVRNRKKERVTVVVVEHPTGDWEVVQKSHEFTKKDAATIEFPVTVAAGAEVTITYTVRTRS